MAHSRSFKQLTRPPVHQRPDFPRWPQLPSLLAGFLLGPPEPPPWKFSPESKAGGSLSHGHTVGGIRLVWLITDTAGQAEGKGSTRHLPSQLPPPFGRPFRASAGCRSGVQAVWRRNICGGPQIHHLCSHRVPIELPRRMLPGNAPQIPSSGAFGFRKSDDQTLE